MNGTPRPNGRWIWFFAILAVMAVIFITILVRFNLAQQLTAEKLAAARRLWDERGPKDYDLEYVEQGNISATYTVRVRGGKVIYAEPDERPLSVKQAYYGMNALFDFLEDFLRRDSQPGRPRPFAVASFDQRDGHLLHYVRAVQGTRERLEINVRLTPTGQNSTGG